MIRLRVHRHGHRLKRPSLVNLCKIRKIPHTAKKAVLLQKIIEHDAAHTLKRCLSRMTQKLRESACVIQRAYKRHTRMKPVNEVDPITQEKWNESSRFLLISECGVYAFDPEGLRCYIESTGKLENPLTREPINKIELRRLENTLGKKLNIISEDILAKQNDRMNTLASFEFQFGELMDSLQAAGDHTNEDYDPDVALALIYSRLPFLFQICLNYHQIDPVNVLNMIRHHSERTKLTAHLNDFTDLIQTTLLEIKNMLTPGV